MLDAFPLGRKRGSIPARLLPAVVLAVAPLLVSCSVRSMAVNAMADSMTRSAVVYARDDDPELVGDALPFLLKTVEGLLEESPEHETLLLTACQGFASYAHAYLAVPADVLEEEDLDAARRQRLRASRMFVRARHYGLRALELRHPGIVDAMVEDPKTALLVTDVKDLPVLFWSGSAWAGAISVDKGNMELVADLSVAGALLHRADALDPVWNEGAVHEVLISLEAALSGGQGGSIEAARKHFEIAVELSRGNRLGPYVSLAEAVSIKEQNVTEFQELLHTALEVDMEKAPDQRLANELAHRRAEWLLNHIEDFFIDYEPEEGDS